MSFASITIVRFVNIWEMFIKELVSECQKTIISRPCPKIDENKVFSQILHIGPVDIQLFMIDNP